MPFTPDEEAAIEKILIDLAKTEEGRALLRRYADRINKPNGKTAVRGHRRRVI